MNILSLALLALLGGEQVIDDFRHADTESARASRRADEEPPLAVVVPTEADPGQRGEFEAARETARSVVAMLKELGLGADTIGQRAVMRGTLDGRQIAILPYNPTLGNDCAEALARFVGSGGKLLVCYSLNPRLAAVLGFGKMKHVRQQREGQFAEMRFDVADVAGLPRSVRQKSWNITAAEPAGFHARAIGRWCDGGGKSSGYAAALLSDRDAFLSHIVLSDDHDGKKRLLAALLGHLLPPLWKRMAETRLEQVGQVGTCANADEAEAYLKTKEPDAKKRLDSVRRSLKAAENLFAQGAYAQSVEKAENAQEMLIQAYVRAAESPQREGRGVWCNPGAGPYPGDWNRSAKLLAENGFNMVLPNMLWGGLAHYRSDVLPRSAIFGKYGDQLNQCCIAAKKHGIEVHVWKVNYNLETASKEFIERLRREGRAQVTVEGKPTDWLCPSHPENQKLELESMLEVARKYPVAGLHFDYIRYPGRECCYCDGCRRRFEAESGRKVLDCDWPKECYSGDRKAEYNDWRCRQITALVAAVSRAAKQIRPGLKISAAVFGSYPVCRESIAQDWPEWIKAGYLDFVCPMDYTNSDKKFAAMVRNQMKLIGGRVPLYAGIGARSSDSTLGPDRVVGQILLARSLGATGFTIFNFEQSVAAAIVPAVGLGAGSRKAVPPHHTTP